MRTRGLFCERLMPIPVVFPLAQNALSNGTNVHCSEGAVRGMPVGIEPPVPPVEVVPVPALLPQAVRPMDPKSRKVVMRMGGASNTSVARPADLHHRSILPPAWNDP